MKNIKSLAFVALLSSTVPFLIVGCGGGDVDNSTTNTDGSSSENGNGGEHSSRNHAKHLIDSSLVGVEYYCDGKEARKTTSTGEFSCENPPVEFKIGKLKLGTVNRFTFDGNIFPQDLVGISRDDYNNTKLLELIRLLQSLDAGGDIDTAIVIPDDMASLFDDEAINNKSLEEKADVAGVDLVDKDVAVDHLTNSMMNVKRDIGQFGLDGVKMWMTGCGYKHGKNRDSGGVTIVSLDFQERKAKMGTQGGYIWPYEFIENSYFKLFQPNDKPMMYATSIGDGYYKDTISEKKETISLWATEEEAKTYQDKVMQGLRHEVQMYRTCEIGAHYPH